MSGCFRVGLGWFAAAVCVVGSGTAVAGGDEAGDPGVRDERREALREFVETWWLVRGSEAPDAEELAALIDEAITAEEDLDGVGGRAGEDQPAFDDRWWPTGLAEAGAPRPAVLDERLRGDLEWARAVRELRLSMQQEALPAGGPNMWPTVVRLAVAFESGTRLEEERLAQAAGLGRRERQRLNWFLRWKPKSDEAAETLRDLEMLEEAERARERVGSLLSEGVAELAEAGPDALFLAPVDAPLRSTTTTWWAWTDLPDLGWYLKGRAEERARAGDVRGAAVGLSALLTFGAYLPRDGSALGIGMGASFVKQGVDRTMRGLRGTRVDGAGLAALESALGCFRPGETEWAVRGAELEVLVTLDTVARHARSSTADSAAARQTALSMSRMTGTLSSLGTQRAVLSVWMDAYGVVLSDGASAEERARAERVLAVLESEAVEDEVAARAPGLIIAMPAMRRVNTGRQRAVEAVERARLVLAVERWKLEHGSAPASLAALGVIDAEEAAAWRYEPAADQEGAGDGFGEGYELERVERSPTR